MNFLPPTDDERNPDLIEAEAYELLAKAKRLRAEQAPPTASANALVATKVAAAELGITERVLKDDLRRRGVDIEKVGAASFVRRDQLTSIAPRKVAPPTDDPRAAARASVAATAARIGGR